MGYRSDVGLALTQSAVQTLTQKLNALDKTSEAFSVITDFFAYAGKRLKTLTPVLKSICGNI